MKIIPMRRKRAMIMSTRIKLEVMMVTLASLSPDSSRTDGGGRSAKKSITPVMAICREVASEAISS